MENILLELINKKEYEYIGEGYNSKSYRFIINSKKYILLKGQISESSICYEQSYKSIKFLNNEGNPYIKSVKIPNKGIIVIKPNDKNIFFKNGCLFYEEIEGLIFYEKYFNKINKENIANKLSAFLYELYNIPINNSDVQRAKNYIISQFNGDIETVKNYFEGKNIDKINEFEKEFLEYFNEFDDYHYTHGDLWEENMIISDDYQDLIGIVDFDNFILGDIAKDFASLLDLGFDFVNLLVQKNEKCFKDKNEFIKRIKLYEKKIIIDDLAYILGSDNLKWRLNSKLEELKKLCLI